MLCHVTIVSLQFQSSQQIRTVKAKLDTNTNYSKFIWAREYIRARIVLLKNDEKHTRISSELCALH